MMLFAQNYRLVIISSSLLILVLATACGTDETTTARDLREIVQPTDSDPDPVAAPKAGGDHVEDDLDDEQEDYQQDDQAIDLNHMTITIRRDGMNLNLYDYITEVEMKAPHEVEDLDAVTFIIAEGTMIGSESTAQPALKMGRWPEHTQIKLVVEEGAYVVGRGGAGGKSRKANKENRGGPGGPAIYTDRPLTIKNAGIVAGGGGGGGGESVPSSGIDLPTGGGAGAGHKPGKIRGNLVTSKATLTEGGDGGEYEYNGVTARGGRGGDLGQPGESSHYFKNSGGPAGPAIMSPWDEVIIIEEETGEILGDISNDKL